jgi:hypothetical protein
MRRWGRSVRREGYPTDRSEVPGGVWAPRSLLVQQSPGHLCRRWSGDFSPSARAHPGLPTTKGSLLITSPLAHPPRKMIRERQKPSRSGRKRPGLLPLTLWGSHRLTSNHLSGTLASGHAAGGACGCQAAGTCASTGGRVARQWQPCPCSAGHEVLR